MYALRQLKTCSASSRAVCNSPDQDKTHIVPSAPGRVVGFLPTAGTARVPERKLVLLPGRHSLWGPSASPQGNLQPEFLLGAFGGVGQGLEHLQPSGEVS